MNNVVRATYWQNNSHLRTNTGGTVFNEAKTAVSDLLAIIKDTHGPVSDSTAQGLINSIVNPLRKVATIAIGEAHKPSNINQANSELSKGDASVAAGKPDDAVGHYKNAWATAIQG